MDVLKTIGGLATQQNISTAGVFIALMIAANFFEGATRTLLVITAFAAAAGYYVYFT